MSNTQRSNVTKLERKDKREIAALREQLNEIKMELFAQHQMLVAAYAAHETLPSEAVAAMISGLENRLVKMAKV